MKKKRLIIFNLFCVAFLLISTGINFAQKITVRGTITDATSDNPLPGVNIVEKGTSNGTVTDQDGAYTIDVAGPSSILEFSYVGFLTETIQVRGQGEISMSMVEDIMNLEELVVIGYGTQKKSDLTGSVSVVNTENLEKIKSNNIAKVLQGQTPGVQVFGGGEPGAMQRVQIRGIGTFGTTEPLYVIDGVPIAPATNINISGQYLQFEDNAPGYGLSSPAGGISDFNPDNIESIQVLKDASAAAIYGARGANGVIIITTKRGKVGTMKVSYEGNYGLQNIPKSTWLDMTRTLQFQEINNTARLNDASFIARVNNPARPEYISPDSIDTDWQKETFDGAYTTDHNLSIQGGTENATYYGNVNYSDQTGTVVGPGPRYTKYSAQLNLDQKKGRIKFGESFSYTQSDQIRLTSSRWSNYMIELVQAIPIVQIYDTNNIGGYGGGNANYIQTAGNPIAFNNLKEASFQRHRFFGVLYGEVELLKGLSYRINLSYDRSEWFNKEFIPRYDVGSKHTWEISMLNEWRGENPIMIMEHLLNFKKVFGKHDLAAVIGYTAQKDHIEDIYAHSEGYTEPYKKVISAGEAATQTSTGKRLEHTMLSYLGRFNYSYGDRYLVTGSWRRDFSSNFGPNNKYGDFPSFALGWKISNEPFFNFPFINMLKFRGGWGKIGNEKITPYQYETTVNNAVSYVFDGQLFNGTTQTRFIDPSIRWEERITTNVGFDLAMLNNKVELSAEYYHNTANDILMGYPLPISSSSIGWQIEAANGASMTNKGIEISASYRKFEGDFHYQISGNLTTLKNEVTRIGGANLPIAGDASRTQVGHSMGELYGYVFEGIFQSADQINASAPGQPGYDSTKHAFQNVRTAPGDVMFKDRNGDGQITVDDRTFLGVAIPKFTFGLNLNAEYKGFDLSVFIQGVYGNKVFNNVYRIANQLWEGNYSVESYENYWRDLPGDSLDRFSTKWPRPTIIDANENNRVSDRWVQDGSYIKIQNVQLGYTFPKSILNRIPGIDNFRIYIQAQNLFTFTKLYGYDPDFVSDGTFNRGYSNGSYPSPRTFLVGVKIGL